MQAKDYERLRKKNPAIRLFFMVLLKDYEILGKVIGFP